MTRTITTAAELDAQYVAPEAAVTLRAVIDEALADALGDTFSPSVMDDLARRVHARVAAALPLPTAAPSATRDEVARALVPTLDEWWCGDHVDYHATDDEGDDLPCCVAERQSQGQRQADALLTRFNITPKEDR